MEGYFKAMTGQAADLSATDHTFPRTTSAIYVGGAGDLTVAMATGNVLFAGVTVGTVLPIGTKIIRKTGTAATNIVGLFAGEELTKGP